MFNVLVSGCKIVSTNININANVLELYSFRYQRLLNLKLQDLN